MENKLFPIPVIISWMDRERGDAGNKVFINNGNYSRKQLLMNTNK
jgi:hypothetical protein